MGAPRTWSGWHVAWAYDGIGDLAAHVGVDRVPLTVPDEEERFRPGRTMTAAQLEANPCHLLTVRHATGALTVHPLTPICHIAWQGPGLLDDLPGPGVSGLVLAEPPASGTHIDVAAHRVGVWIGYHATGLVPSLPRLWPGWHVDFWDDRWEDQLARCDDAVGAPATDPIEAVDRLAEAIDDDIAHDPLPGMLDLAHAEGPEGTTPVLDPHLTAHVHTPPPPDALHHLHTALAALRHEATRPR